MDVAALEGDQLTAQKGGKSGKDANDPTVNPTFTVTFPAPVTTRGIRLLVTSVINMVDGTVSIYEIEAY